MAFWSRERKHTQWLVIVAGALLFYVTVLQSYIDKRDEMAAQRDVGMKAVADAHNTLNRRSELSLYLNSRGASLKTDAATVETEFLHQTHDWESQLNIHNTSFQRVVTAQDHGFTRLGFQITGTGGMAAVATMLYRIETSPMVRLEAADVRPSGEGEDLQMRFTVAALCNWVPPKAAVTLVPSAEDNLLEAR